jgi:hypothetical protein
LAVLELFVFARLNRPVFALAEALPAELMAYLDSRPGHYRILNLLNHNLAMSAGAYDIWGYDPGVTKRYAELIAHSQGQTGERATQYVTFRQLPPLYRMLRCRYAFVPEARDFRVAELPGPMPRVAIIHQCLVAQQRDQVLAILAAEDFDPTATVVLEESPSPAPVPATGHEQAQIVAATTDTMTIEAELTTPGILLITDAYSAGWHARPGEGSTQQSYQILPANYALRGIPLVAGSHRIRLEYVPSGFRAGCCISAVTWTGWGAILVTGLIGHRRRAKKVNHTLERAKR